MWGYDYGYGHPMMWGGGYGIEHGIFSFLWVILLIVFIVAAIRWVRGKPVGHWKHFRGESSALEILKERYAKGEINKAEFEEKKKDLS